MKLEEVIRDALGCVYDEDDAIVIDGTEIDREGKLIFTHGTIIIDEREGYFEEGITLMYEGNKFIIDRWGALGLDDGAICYDFNLTKVNK